MSLSLREAVLGRAAGYRAFKSAIRGDQTMATIAEEYVRAREGHRVLDIGCGYGDMLDHLPDVDYLGVDLSDAYLGLAEKRVNGAGRFRRVDVSDAEQLANLGSFDVVMAIGLLHHLPDVDARVLLSAVPSLLAEGGRLVTVDPVWAPEQRTFARVAIALDRGRHVHAADGYAALVAERLHEVRVAVRHDLLVVPYTHCITESRRPSESI